MPLISVRLIENVFSAEQKQQIARDLTEAMVAIEGERMRGVTWCVIEEVKSGDPSGNPREPPSGWCAALRPARVPPVRGVTNRGGPGRAA